MTHTAIQSLHFMILQIARTHRRIQTKSCQLQRLKIQYFIIIIITFVKG